MKGTRPLDNTEILRVSTCFTGTFEVRNRGLFMLGVSAGGRISELLSLTIGDVYQNQQPVTDLLFDKSIVKGGEVSRVSVPVNSDGRQAIVDLVAWHRERYHARRAYRPLFPSRNKRGSITMNRQTAHEIFKKAFTAAGLNGDQLATQSLRKSFAQRLYEESTDIYLVQELIGHKSVATTQKYLGVHYQSARQACERMAVSRQHDRIDVLSHSLKTIDDQTLITELQGCGYNLDIPQENKTTAEIVKIG